MTKNIPNRCQLLRTLLGSARQIVTTVALAGAVVVASTVVATSPKEQASVQESSATSATLQERAKQLSSDPEGTPQAGTSNQLADGFLKATWNKKAVA